MASQSVTPKPASKLSAVKPATKKPAAPKPEVDRLSLEGRKIVHLAVKQTIKIADQMRALGSFCFAITEDNAELYNFSVGQYEMLHLIEKEALKIHNDLVRLVNPPVEGGDSK